MGKGPARRALSHFGGIPTSPVARPVSWGSLHGFPYGTDDAAEFFRIGQGGRDFIWGKKSGVPEQSQPVRGPAGFLERDGEYVEEIRAGLTSDGLLDLDADAGAAADELPRQDEFPFRRNPMPAEPDDLHREGIALLLNRFSFIVSPWRLKLFCTTKYQLEIKITNY
jgi:hypothetical protein